MARLFASLHFVSQAMSSVLGIGVAWLVSIALTPADLQAWGFRIPFILGLIVAPVGLYIRRTVPETPEFAAAARLAAPVRILFTRHGGCVALAACLIAAATAGTYLEICLPVFAQVQLHMPVSAGFLASLVISVLAVFVTLLAARASDRIGRFPILFGGMAVLLAVIFPAFRLILRYPNLWMLTAMQIVLSVPRSVYAAPLPALRAEMFPIGARVIGLSLGYTLGVVVFGGIVGLIVHWLIAATGAPLVSAYYLAVATGISLGAAILARRDRYQPAYGEGQGQGPWPSP